MSYKSNGRQKCAYICGPLTELTPAEQLSAKQLYVRLADVCQEAMGLRGFVPHEHCDPALHANLSPSEVDFIERAQICKKTKLLVVVAIAPSWGGGIEVEIANHAGVPGVLLHPEGKRVSRLLRGNPTLARDPIVYKTIDDAAEKFCAFLSAVHSHGVFAAS